MATLVLSGSPRYRSLNCEAEPREQICRINSSLDLAKPCVVGTVQPRAPLLHTEFRIHVVDKAAERSRLHQSILERLEKILHVCNAIARPDTTSSNSINTDQPEIVAVRERVIAVGDVGDRNVDRSASSSSGSDPGQYNRAGAVRTRLALRPRHR